MKKLWIAVTSAMLLICMLSSCASSKRGNASESSMSANSVKTTASEMAVSDSVGATSVPTETSSEPVSAPAGATSAPTAASSAPVSVPAKAASAPAAASSEVVSSATATDSMYPTILTYHLILDEPYTKFVNLFVKVSDFESQLKQLCDAGYSFLFADEFGKVTSKSVILTFDDGYQDNYTNLFPLLKKYNAKATVFMISASIDTKNYLKSEQIREMAASGLVQFGSHTVSHRDLQTLSKEEQREQLANSKAALQALTGQQINALCYPAGSYDSATLALAAEYYSFGYTTHRGKYSGENVFELPRIAVQRGMGAGQLLRTLEK